MSGFERLLRLRTADWLSPPGLIRLGLLAFGVAAGSFAVTSVVAIGGGMRAFFADLDAQVTEPGRVVIEPGEGTRFTPLALDSLAARASRAHLCPVLEAEGHTPALEGASVRVLGVDFLGDPRVSIVTSWLDASRLEALVRPTVLVPARLIADGVIVPGQAIEITVEGFTETFSVSEMPLPIELYTRSMGPVLAIDLARFQSAFRAAGGIDRIAVVASSPAAMLRVESEIAPHLPPGARLLGLGDGSRLARAWIETWRQTAGLAVSVGFLVGVVIVHLSVQIAHRRLEPLARAAVDAGHGWRSVLGVQLAEVTVVTLVAAGIGALEGRLLASLTSDWAVGLGPFEPITPIRPAGFPFAPLLVALVMGLFVPSLLTAIARIGTHVPRAAATVDVPRAPAAIAGVLFVLASMLVVPGPGAGSVELGYAAVLLVLIGLGLLGRPLMAAAAQLALQLAGTRWPLATRALVVQLREVPAELGASLGLLVFTFATIATLLTITGELARRNDAWLAEAFRSDLALEVPGEDAEVGKASLLSGEVEARLRDLEGVVSVGVERPLRATLDGATLPLALVSAERLHDLQLVQRASHAAAVRADTTRPPLVQLYVPDDLARELGLFPGAASWIDTGSGSWRVVVAGVYRPHFSRAALALADAGRYRNLLAPDGGLGAVDVRFEPGTDPRAGRDRVRARLDGLGPFRYRPLDAARPHLRRAFALARSAVHVLVGLLATLGVTAVAVVGIGAAYDFPEGWRVMAALGVPRGSIAAGACVALAGAAACALAAGVGGGYLAGLLLTGSLSAPAIGWFAGFGATGGLVVLVAAGWGLTTALAIAALRGPGLLRALTPGRGAR